jgi:hypothetical protein
LFILLEFPSPSRRIFIGSHSLPPLWFAVSVLQKGKNKEEGREGDKVWWWVPLWTVRCCCRGAPARPLAAPLGKVRTCRIVLGATFAKIVVALGGSLLVGADNLNDATANLRPWRTPAAMKMSMKGLPSLVLWYSVSSNSMTPPRYWRAPGQHNRSSQSARRFTSTLATPTRVRRSPRCKESNDRSLIGGGDELGNLKTLTYGFTTFTQI